jgi:hypothetical protein
MNNARQGITLMATARAQVRPDSSPTPRAGDDQPEDQVHPAPGGLVELEEVLLGVDVEVVVEDRHQAGEGLEHAHDEHHHGGEQDETDGHASSLPLAAPRSISR